MGNLWWLSTESSSVCGWRHSEASGEVLAEEIIGGEPDCMANGGDGEVALLEKPLALPYPKVIEPGDGRGSEVFREPTMERSG